MPAECPLWLHEWESVDQIWTRLHRTQTDFCFGQELAFYFTSEAWLGSERVIDIGTGSGYYLHRMATIFPEKIYLGIDINDFYIETAKRSFGEGNVRFERGDLYTEEGEYDVAIVRLVMQHLADVETGIRKLAGLLRPGGTAFVIDAADPRRYYYPEPEEYIRFFRGYAAAERRSGKDRDIAGKVPDLLETIPELRCISDETTVIPSTVPGNAPLFEETYYLVIQLLEKAKALDCDYETVKRAWLDWCALPRKYAQVGIRCVKLVRELS